MKHSLYFTIIFLVFSSVPTMAQYYPQYYDNSPHGSITESQNYDNIQHESLILKMELLFENDLPETVKLARLYRIYEIEQIASIDYVTYSGEELGLSTEDDDNNGFGCAIAENGRNKNKSNEEIDVYTVKFKEPVIKIPASFFSADLVYARLPGSTDIIYPSSPSISVARLERLSGGNVRENALISQEGTLIVAATAGVDDYQIPNGVRRIGAGSLRQSTITNLVIGDEVTFIGDNALEGTHLQTLTLLATTPPMIGDNVFGETPPTVLLVPKKSIKSYKRAWPKLKKNIKGIK